MTGPVRRRLRHALVRGAAALGLGALGSSAAVAQSGGCPARPNLGSIVSNPTDLYAKDGVLAAAFTLRSEQGGFLEECYVYDSATGPVEAPTLRLNPGDRLELRLTNRLSYLPPAAPQRSPLPSGTGSLTSGLKLPMCVAPRSTADNPCTGGTAVATSTNIHFHGLNITPVCHKDEVINTDIENRDPPFDYRFELPRNDAPGMFWYHAHLHGQATLQVNGGAAGALIVGGMERVKPQVAGLPERVFVIRQQFKNPNSWIAGPYQLTLNFAPAVPALPLPIVQVQPGTREFWRVANASSQAFLNLAVIVGGVAQAVEIIALDGVPVSARYATSTVTLPPAGRAEFIVTAPAAGQPAGFWQTGFDTGPIGNANNAQQLAVIEATTAAREPPALPAAPAASGPSAPLRFDGLRSVRPTEHRKLYFAEATNGTNGPTEFFIALDGHTPKVFSATDEPLITTRVGKVEEWTVENRSGEAHAFHIHQIHFLFQAVDAVPLDNPQLRDTVVVPAWNGQGPYPSVTLRMDFRDPDIAGTFVFHCHVLDHEDAGMMAKIRVNPARGAD